VDSGGEEELSCSTIAGFEEEDVEEQREMRLRSEEDLVEESVWQPLQPR
jgi:hypothetical protein